MYQHLLLNAIEKVMDSTECRSLPTVSSSSSPGDVTHIKFTFSDFKTLQIFIQNHCGKIL